MAIGRYTFTPAIMGRSILATNTSSTRIFNACENGTLMFQSITLSESQRLDHIAGNAYGSSTLWWVIAAASGIGWGLQVPAGTIIRVPQNISNVMALIR